MMAVAEGKQIDVVFNECWLNNNEYNAMIPKYILSFTVSILFFSISPFWLNLNIKFNKMEDGKTLFSLSFVAWRQNANKTLSLSYGIDICMYILPSIKEMYGFSIWLAFVSLARDGVAPALTFRISGTIEWWIRSTSRMLVKLKTVTSRNDPLISNPF